MRGIFRDTVAELIDRKFVWAFGIITLFSVGLAVLGAQQLAEFSVNSEEMGLGEDLMKEALVRGTVNYVYFMLFIAVMASAGLIPRMLDRGRADFYLSKPMSRTSLLLTKFLTVWLVYSAVVILCSVLVYLATAIPGEGVDPSILYAFLFVPIMMAIWLSIVVAAGVLFNSTPLAMLIAFVIWVVQFIFQGYETFNAVIYGFLGVYKIVFISFNLVPFIALSIIG